MPTGARQQTSDSSIATAKSATHPPRSKRLRRNTSPGIAAPSASVAVFALAAAAAAAAAFRAAGADIDQIRPTSCTDVVVAVATTQTPR